MNDKIKSVIFDADGTLFDSMHIWHGLGEKYLGTLNIKVKEDLDKVLLPLTVGQGALYLKEHYLFNKSVNEIEKGIKDLVFEFYKNDVFPKEGVIDFLKYLKSKNIPCVIVSTNEKDLVYSAVKNNRMEEYFSEIFSCADYKTDKKVPDVYLKAAEFMNCKPCNTAVFEDTPIPIKTVSSAGFYTVGVSDKESLKYEDEIKSASDLFIYGFSDLKKYLI